MHNTKLIRVLRTFTKDEWHEYEKIAASPYFNRGRNLTPFVKELRKFYPDFSSPKLTRQYLYAKVYKGKSYNDNTMKKMLSELFEMADLFLAVNTFRKNKFEVSRFAAIAYTEKRLGKHLADKISDMERGNTQYYSTFYFLNNIFIEVFKRFSFELLDKQELVTDTYYKEGEYQIMFFLTEMYQILSSIRTNKNLYNKDFPSNVSEYFFKNINLNQVIDYCRENKFRYSDILEIYILMIIILLERERPEYFHRLAALITEKYKQFSPEEAMNIFGFLANYSLNKIRAGLNEFRRTLFEINNLRLEIRNEHYPEKIMPKVYFSQQINNSIYLGEIEWTKNFINEYKNFLLPEYRDTMQSIGYALIYFRSGEYNKVINELSKTVFNDIRDKLQVKNLLARTYYELNENDTLYYFLDSYLHFHKTNRKVSRRDKKPIENFIMFLKKVILFKEGKYEKSLMELKNEISLQPELKFKDWLLEKVKSLKNPQI
jgi:hypothetical protein